MLDKRFPITESQDIVVNLTFSTTVLTDGSGGEERNINWQSPLLSYDLQQVLIRKTQLDEIVNFFKEARGAATAFRYRDWSDYRVTPEPTANKYGSSTIGILFPHPDGERTEFGLVKRYTLENCSHFRGILLPDPDTIKIYDIDLNPIPDTDWIYDTGKFIFTTPPSGYLTVEGQFDVPVVFGNDELQYRTKATKDGNAYSIEGLQLEEIREYPFTLLYDEIEDLQNPFALANYFDAIAGLREQTEIIDLVSGFDRRTSRFQTPKQTFTLGKIPLRDDELEYLITFFRCVKGKGLRFALLQDDNRLPIRFNDDTLTLRLNKKNRYEVDGIRAIEVFEPLTLLLRYRYPGEEWQTIQGADDYTLDSSPVLANTGYFAYGTFYSKNSSATGCNVTGWWRTHYSVAPNAVVSYDPINNGGLYMIMQKDGSGNPLVWLDKNAYDSNATGRSASSAYIYHVDKNAGCRNRTQPTYGCEPLRTKLARADGQLDPENCVFTVYKNGEIIHQETRDACPEVSFF